MKTLNIIFIILIIAGGGYYYYQTQLSETGTELSLLGGEGDQCRQVCIDKGFAGGRTSDQCAVNEALVSPNCCCSSAGSADLDSPVTVPIGGSDGASGRNNQPSGSAAGSFRDKCLNYNSVQAQVRSTYGGAIAPGSSQTELATYNGETVCHLVMSTGGLQQDQYFTEEVIDSGAKTGKMWVVMSQGDMKIEQAIVDGKVVKVTCTPASPACAQMEKAYSGAIGF